MLHRVHRHRAEEFADQVVRGRFHGTAEIRLRLREGGDDHGQQEPAQGFDLAQQLVAAIAVTPAVLAMLARAFFHFVVQDRRVAAAKKLGELAEQLRQMVDQLLMGHAIGRGHVRVAPYGYGPLLSEDPLAGIDEVRQARQRRFARLSVHFPAPRAGV